MSKHGEEWGFFGGGIEHGETPEQALKREIREELTYDIKKFEFFKEYPSKIYGDMKIAYSVFTAQAPLLSEFKQAEGDSMKFFTITQAKELKLVEGDYPILDDLEELFNL